MVTKRLGKGLEALIRPYEETQAAATPVGVTDIFLSKIKANPNQPRKDGLDKSSLEDLVASIKEKGVITPITVQEVDKGFMLVAGERRWRAAMLAGLKKIPVYIINVTDDAELMEMALIENIQRENLNAIEEAEAFDVLQNEFNLNLSSLKEYDLNKSLTGCAPCLKEAQRIDRQVNKKSLSEIKIEEIKKIIRSIFQDSNNDT